jgi:hypothetical protein
MIDKIHQLGEESLGYVIAFGFGFVVAMLAFGN